MPLTKLQFKPGINREGTNYSNEGGWFDGDKIRFQSGYVERIGGWNKVATTTFEGSCRNMLNFVTLASQNLLFMGTHKKAYLEDGGTYYDITPLRTTLTLGTDPITTGAAGSGIITVAATNHGSSAGDFVTIAGATDTDGILAADLNGNFEIITALTNSFTVDTGGSATTGSVSGGGGSVTAAMEISIGLDTTILGNGWGAGTWGRSTWGSGAGSLAGQNLRLWASDSWGEDLVANLVDGKIYYWDATNGLSARMVELSSVAGALNAPTTVRKVLVSDVDRHVLCFGCNPVDSATFDPLLIRWSSQESVTDWTPTAVNTSGDLRLSQGSEIVTAIRTTRQILVFTESSLHSVQFVGAPFVFGTALIGSNVRIAGPNTGISVHDVVFWMGQENFYLYDGRIQPIPCSVRQYVFDDINRNQSFKFHAGSLSSNSEIWWYYCSANSEEIDRYVVYNYLEQTWYYGTLVRTAWNDRASGSRLFPQAAGKDGVLYNHENGLDDGSVNPPVAVNAFIESADFDIGDGQNFMLVNRVLPDLNFTSSTASTPNVSFVMNARNYNGNARGVVETISLGTNPLTTGAITSGVLTIKVPDHVAVVGDYVTLSGATSFDGLTTTQLNARFKITERVSLALGADPLTTAAAVGGVTSGVVTVSATAHGALVGDYVNITGSNPIDGILFGQINSRYIITSVPTANTFTIDTGISATAGGVTAGGNNVQIAFDRYKVTTGGAATVGAVSGGGASVTAEFEKSGDVTRSAVINGADDYTDEVFLRLRGRQVNLKVESNEVGVNWRLGAPRLDMRPDGRR